MQDLGAGGITGSSAEMAGAAGLGVIVHLDKVPQREKDMRDYDVALSESQERALICATPQNVEKIIRIAEKWDLRAAEVGVVTETGKLQMMWDKEIVCDLPISLIDMELEYDRPQKKPHAKKIDDHVPYIGSKADDIENVLLKMSSNPNISSKKWVWRQYDSQVQASTIFKQGNDSGVIKVPDSDLAVGITADAKPMWCSVDPYWGAAHTVVESVCNLASKGIKALGTTNCLNFGNPENPAVMYSFSKAVDGITKACLEMDTPITGGNVSFYNESPDGAVPPTPSIGMVGVAKDVSKILGSEIHAGDKIYVFGNENWGLEGSEFLRYVMESKQTMLPELNFKHARSSIKQAIDIRKEVKWMADVSEGGIFDCILRMIPKGHGINLFCPEEIHWTSFLFSEEAHRFIVCCDKEIHLENAVLIGEISEEEIFSIKKEDLFSVDFEILKNAFENTIEDIAEL
ncbi:hypothetical protein CL645_04320 [bacterium]|nr:hypothetical protein [bacterium]